MTATKSAAAVSGQNPPTPADRVAAILNCPQAKGLETFAEHLAHNTLATVDETISALATLRRETQALAGAMWGQHMQTLLNAGGIDRHRASNPS
jgi:hypothetical protein